MSRRDRRTSSRASPKSSSRTGAFHSNLKAGPGEFAYASDLVPLGTSLLKEGAHFPKLRIPLFDELLARPPCQRL